MSAKGCTVQVDDSSEPQPLVQREEGVCTTCWLIPPFGVSQSPSPLPRSPGAQEGGV